MDSELLTGIMVINFPAAESSTAFQMNDDNSNEHVSFLQSKKSVLIEDDKIETIEMQENPEDYLDQRFEPLGDTLIKDDGTNPEIMKGTNGDCEPNSQHKKSSMNLRAKCIVGLMAMLIVALLLFMFGWICMHMK